MVPSNKERLYVSLFATGQRQGVPERVFHWALTTGPKVETEDSRGHRMHVKNEMRPDGAGGFHQKWVYQDIDVTVLATAQSIARICIGKILDMDKVRDIVASVPVVQDDPTWRCRQWVIDAVSALASSTGGAVGRSVDLHNWQAIEAVAKGYGNEKVDAGRFRVGGGKWDITKVPTFDMMAGRELIFPPVLVVHDRMPGRRVLPVLGQPAATAPIQDCRNLAVFVEEVERVEVTVCEAGGPVELPALLLGW
ncbi:hypothetical protein FH972_025965 [Carpinus fangiana]|uniref:Uncharacterized protein n=1 Tax=Carpinus fangiana TaxID=176857 RepID=A0A5N6L2X3_9ROSI|nr:hypothetical protein FH972_025965 [Carpinus fangiana]